MARAASTRRAPRSRLVRAALFALVLAAVTGLGAIASGCGGSEPEGVAQVETTETTKTATTEPSSSGGSREPNPAAYAACMRKNGVPKFPDPDANGRLQIQGEEGLGPNPTAFKRADAACNHFLPDGGGEDTLDPEEQAEALEKALEHAACMRKSGVPNYPDPEQNAQGGLGLSLDGTGVDPRSPQFQAAEEACKDLAPGADGGDSQRGFAPAPGSNSGGAGP